MKILKTLFLLPVAFGSILAASANEFKFDNKAIDSGISGSYDKIVFKQTNVKFGLGGEYLFSRDVGDKKFNASGVYLLLRYAYGKKWNSYLRLGYNRISGIQDKDRNGLLCGFGVDYKLNDKWYFETGYHILSTNETYASRIACSISRHFKKKDDK